MLLLSDHLYSLKGLKGPHEQCPIAKFLGKCAECTDKILIIVISFNHIVPLMKAIEGEYKSINTSK